MPFSLNVRRHGLARRQLHPRDLALRRIRLLGLHDSDLRADTFALVVALESYGDGALDLSFWLSAGRLVERHGTELGEERRGRCVLDAIES